MESRAAEVLTFWFGTLDERGLPEKSVSQRWFRGGPAFDEEIHERFGDEIEAALRGGLDGWASTPRGRLALVILLDQFTRNVFRGSARSYAGDARALDQVRGALAAGENQELAPVERYFLYMPLEHAEDRGAQARCVELFEALTRESGERLFSDGLDWARRHRVVIDRFGRFPSRNVVLGRESTAEEEVFLKENPSGF